jgi:RNA polymerase sigma-70 factor (ECF subfamily)
MAAMPAHLIAAIAAGDPAAWERLIAAHGAAMRRACARVAGASLADDALQEALLQVRDGAAAFAVPSGRDAASAERAWLLALAVNSALQLLRADRRRRRRDHLATVHPEPTEDDPGDELVSRESASIIRAALAELPAAMRTAVALRHCEGLGTGAIAGILGIPEGTAKALVHRGLERLRRGLERRRPALGLAGITAMLAMLPTDGAAHVQTSPPPVDARTMTHLLPHRRRTAPWHALAAGMAMVLGGVLALRVAMTLADDPAPDGAPSDGVMGPMASEPLPARTPTGRAGPSAADLFPSDVLVGGASTSGVQVWHSSDIAAPLDCRITVREGIPWLEARRDGMVVFSGPVGSADDLALVPEDVLAAADGLGLDFRATVRPGRLEVRSGNGGASPSPTPQ